MRREVRMARYDVHRCSRTDALWCCCMAQFSMSTGAGDQGTLVDAGYRVWCRTRSGLANLQGPAQTCISTRWRAITVRAARIICRSRRPISSRFAGRHARRADRARIVRTGSGICCWWHDWPGSTGSCTADANPKKILANEDKLTAEGSASSRDQVFAKDCRRIRSRPFIRRAQTSRAVRNLSAAAGPLSVGAMNLSETVVQRNYASRPTRSMGADDTTRRANRMLRNAAAEDGPNAEIAKASWRPKMPDARAEVVPNAGSGVIGSAFTVQRMMLAFWPKWSPCAQERNRLPVRRRQ